jgi:hypothetical protein
MALSKLQYGQRSQKGKGTGAKKQMPQVTHQFPGPRPAFFPLPLQIRLCLPFGLQLLF